MDNMFTPPLPLQILRLQPLHYPLVVHDDVHDSVMDPGLSPFPEFNSVGSQSEPPEVEGARHFPYQAELFLFKRIRQKNIKVAWGTQNTKGKNTGEQIWGREHDGQRRAFRMGCLSYVHT